MALFFQQFLNGLTLGGVYSLVALGLTLVYGILHVPNFAHGAFYMAGAYVSYYAMTSLGMNYWRRPSWWPCCRCWRTAWSFIRCAMRPRFTT